MRHHLAGPFSRPLVPLQAISDALREKERHVRLHRIFPDLIKCIPESVRLFFVEYAPGFFMPEKTPLPYIPYWDGPRVELDQRTEVTPHNLPNDRSSERVWEVEDEEYEVDKIENFKIQLRMYPDLQMRWGYRYQVKWKKHS